MAVDDSGAEVARNRFICIEAASIELLDVGILDEPGDVAGVAATIGFANALHGCTADGAEATAIDVALSIVCVIVEANIGYIKSREVELIEIATSNRYGRVFSWLESIISTCLVLILVAACVELLEPHVASHMDVRDLV